MAFLSRRWVCGTTLPPSCCGRPTGSDPPVSPSAGARSSPVLDPASAEKEFRFPTAPDGDGNVQLAALLRELFEGGLIDVGPADPDRVGRQRLLKLIRPLWLDYRHQHRGAWF